MEVEKNLSLPFLDVLVSRRPDGSLGHTVYTYRKPTHTDLYLHSKSAHHPAQKKGILHSLIHRSRKLCNAVSLDKEIQHLKETLKKWLQQPGYKTGCPKKGQISSKAGEAGRCRQTTLPSSRLT
jgi:hypothetical protein